MVATVVKYPKAMLQTFSISPIVIVTLESSSSYYHDLPQKHETPSIGLSHG